MNSVYITLGKGSRQVKKELESPLTVGEALDVYLLSMPLVAKCGAPDVVFALNVPGAQAIAEVRCIATDCRNLQVNIHMEGDLQDFIKECCSMAVSKEWKHIHIIAYDAQIKLLRESSQGLDFGCWVAWEATSWNMMRCGEYQEKNYIQPRWRVLPMFSMIREYSDSEYLKALLNVEDEEFDIVVDFSQKFEKWKELSWENFVEDLREHKNRGI